MTKFFSTLSLILCFTFVLTAQTNEDSENQQTRSSKSRTYIKDATIEEQFEFIMKKSSRYQIYKVVEIQWLNNLQTNIIDSLDAAKQDFLKSEKLIAERDQKIKSLELELTEKKNALMLTREEKDSISLGGIQMSKSTYNLFIWGLVIGLFVLTSFFFMLFKRSHFVTRDTQQRLEEVREEFDGHRKNALLREQKLARRLQDEVNKNKGMGL